MLNLKKILFYLALICGSTSQVFCLEEIEEGDYLVRSELIQEDTRQHSVETDFLYRPDISFMIADIKYRNGKLKILEFGEGPRSKFRGYDRLYGRGGIWKNFWKYLNNLNLPVWFVTRNVSQNARLKKRIDFKRRTDYGTFTRLGGRAVPSLYALKRDEVFTRLHKEGSARRNLRDYKGVVIIKTLHPRHLSNKYVNRKHNSSTCSSCNRIKAFKQEYSDFLILDDASRYYVSNKKYTDWLFSVPELRSYRPKCKSYQKTYYPGLASRIRKDFKKYQIVVIKPLTAAKGNGIIITDKSKLDGILRNILLRRSALRKLRDKSLRYWYRDRSSQFLVESYEPSKTINVDGRNFDATMRVVFALHYDVGRMYVTFLGSYWKLPAKSLSERGTLNERSKSAIVPKRQCSAKVSHIDSINSKAILREILPKVYERMLQIKRGYIERKDNV